MTAIAVTKLTTPVVSSRKWTTALVPRNGGGWNAIEQWYNYPDRTPTEWAVTHLETGTTALYQDTTYTTNTQGQYASTNFQTRNQLRAPDGGVFFIAQNNYLWHYSATTEAVTLLPKIPSISGTNADTLIHSAVFNQDGTKLFMGTLGNINAGRRPQVQWADTSTLAVTTLTRCGTVGLHTKNAYAYYLAPDGDWLYVLVGQDVWELCAVRVSTGAMTVLAQALGPAPFADFHQHAEGWVARLYTNYGGVSQTYVEYWCIDGAAIPYVAGSVPFTPRDVTPYSNPTSNPPDVDYSLGPGRLLWRANGSTGAYTEIDYPLTYTAPINVESLIALPDGTLFGDVNDYQGWFNYNPSSQHTTYYGAFQGITDGTARIIIGSKAYMSGYPNGPLWEYDPGASWDTAGGTNPKRLGEYSDGIVLSGIKHGARFAYDSSNSRLYMTGTRDRSGSGSGIGYYDFNTRAFGGTYANLNFYVGHLGVVVFHNLSRVVMGGLIGDDPNFPGQTPTVSQLVLFDLDLNEIERQTPIASLIDTGFLFKTSETNVVAGVSPTSMIAYRWNIVSKTLLGQIDLSSYGAIGSAITQAADNTILLIAGSTLLRIDPLTLAVTNLGTLDDPSFTRIIQVGSTIYGALGSGVYHIDPGSSGGTTGGDDSGGSAAAVKVRRLRGNRVPYLGSGLGRLG